MQIKHVSALTVTCLLLSIGNQWQKCCQVKGFLTFTEKKPSVVETHQIHLNGWWCVPVLCRNEIIPQLQSKGPASANIWPGFIAHLVCKNAPEAGATSWMSCYQLKHSSGHLQLATTVQPVSASFSHFYLAYIVVCLWNGVYSPASA